MYAGKAKTHPIHRPHKLQLRRSSSTVLNSRTRQATVVPTMAGTTKPRVSTFQSTGHISDQNKIGAAIDHLAHVSPRTIGAVLLPRRRSPCWSLRSWIWSVVNTISHSIASHARPAWLNVQSLAPHDMSVVAALPHTKPEALIALRRMKSSSEPPRSLYIQLRSKARSVTEVTSSASAMETIHGMRTNSSRRAWTMVILPEGIGRHGLLMMSSATELGNRWLATVKASMFNHIQNKACGRRREIDANRGLRFVVNSGPDTAPKNPKAVHGYTIVRCSLTVKSHTVFK